MGSTLDFSDYKADTETVELREVIDLLKRERQDPDYDGPSLVAVIKELGKPHPLGAVAFSREELVVLITALRGMERVTSDQFTELLRKLKVPIDENESAALFALLASATLKLQERLNAVIGGG